METPVGQGPGGPPALLCTVSPGPSGHCRSGALSFHRRTREPRSGRTDHQLRSKEDTEHIPHCPLGPPTSEFSHPLNTLPKC